MKVKLLKDARILHHAGEIVEVSPVVADFLVSVSNAEPVQPTESPKPVEPEKAATKTTRKSRK